MFSVRPANIAGEKTEQLLYLQAFLWVILIDPLGNTEHACQYSLVKK